MKRYSRKHIGKEFITNEGYKAIVIDGGNRHSYCIIQIMEWVKEVEVKSLIKGSIKYPYHPSVHGIGYYGDGKYKAKIRGKQTKSYVSWKGMLQRCYYKKYHSTHPTYIKCTVSKDWEDYQNFARWYEENYVKGFVLDKDLLLKGNKVYSEDTCVFIPSELNSFLANNHSNNTSGSIGVTYRKNSNVWESRITDCLTGKRIHIGSFSSIQMASLAYKCARTTMAHRMKHKMIMEYGITDLRILDAIDKL